MRSLCLDEDAGNVGQQGRWLDLLSEYHIRIQHHPGRVHGNSDALSRRPCERDGGKDCQQCQQTISSSGAAKANGEEMPTTGQIQPSDTPRPLPPNSSPSKSYYLHQLFLSDSLQSDSSKSTSFISPQVSDTAVDQVEAPNNPVLLDSPIPTSPTTNIATRVQAIVATPEPTSITLDDIRTAQAEDDNLQPVIQALLDQTQPALT